MTRWFSYTTWVGATVVLVSQLDCRFCDQAKELLDRLAGQYDFVVRMVDISTTEGQALAETGGVMFPPGIFVDGDAVSYGRPSERRLRRELDARVPPRP